MTAVIYVRASTGEQVSSCEQQARECTEKAKQLGVKVSEVYKDDGISGSRHDRPEYLKMLEAVVRKEFGTLLLWKQNRLGRDQPEVERAMRRLEFHGVRIITVDGYDTSSSSLKNRKLIRVVKGAMDEAYLDDLREDTLRGQTEQYLKGYWCGGRPYGYRLMEVTSPTEKDVYGHSKRIGSRLEIDKEQAKIVREVFERYAHGANPQGIAADLNERKVPSPGSTWKRKMRRCTGWARSGIWQMLRNPLYSGTYYWKKTQWIKPEGGRRVVKLRKKDEWMQRDAPELAIVTPAIWNLAQVRLRVNEGKPKDKRLQSGGRAVYMLSGLLHCGKCGAHFVMDSATHYRCGSVVDGKACNNDIRVRRDLAEQIILRPVIEELLSPDMVEEMVKEMRAYYQQQVAALHAKRDKVPAEVEELNKRIARLQERLKSGDPDVTADELLAIIQKAEGKRAELLAAGGPEAKRVDKVLHALPAAAAQYRQVIGKGLQGHRAEAGRARFAVRKLLGDTVRLLPAEGGGHLVAHLEFQRAALVAGAVGSVGSGGRL